MQPEDLQERWKELGEQVFAGVAQWRATHRQATLAEIEHVVDEQIYQLRARMIEQTAQASAAAESEASQGLVCEQCGKPLQARGRAKRCYGMEDAGLRALRESTIAARRMWDVLHGSPVTVNWGKA